MTMQEYKNEITEEEGIALIDWLINNWKEEYAKNPKLNVEYAAKLEDLNLMVSPKYSDGVSVIRRSLCRVSTENGNILEDLRTFWNSNKNGPLEWLLSTIAMMPWRKACFTLTSHLHQSIEEQNPTFKQKYPKVRVVIDLSDASNLKVIEKFRSLNIFYLWFPVSDKQKLDVNVLFSSLSILRECEKKNYSVLINSNSGTSHKDFVLDAYAQINDGIEIYTEQNYTLGSAIIGNDSLSSKQVNSFLKRAKQYFDGKASFTGKPLDWCMEGIRE